jgi:hypothetical protein
MTQAIDLIKRNARVAALIAVAVVLVVVTFVFYSGSQSSADQQATIEKQFTSAKASLTVAQDQYDVAKLQDQDNSLSNAISFPTTFPGVGLSAYIAGAADKYGVEVVSLTPKDTIGTETIGGNKYTRYDTVVQVTGDYKSMDSFLSYLEAGQSGQFPSLRIENAAFTPTGGTFTVVILTQ